jgi:hypothetical protein
VDGGAGGRDPCIDASLPNDSDHPGTIDAGCGIACGAVQCPVRCGEPRVLVGMPFDQQITAIAVSADTLYFGTYPEQGPGAIYAMALSGGAPTVLVGDVLVRELRLDGDTLYYATGPGGLTGVSLLAIPITGGAAIGLYAAVDITSITPDVSGVYFQVGFSGRLPGIVHTRRDGTGTTMVVSPVTTSGLAVDDENIYWTSGSTLVQYSLVRSVTTTLAAATEPMTSPIVDGSDIAFVQRPSTTDTCGGAVMAIPKAGGTQTPISPGTSGADVGGLARDDAHVYWSSTGVHGAIVRVRKGQLPEIIAADQQFPERTTEAPSALRPVLGATDVYWIARGATGYEVRTVPK